MAAEKAKHLKGNQVCDEFAVKHTYISMHNALCVNFKKMKMLDTIAFFV